MFAASRAGNDRAFTDAAHALGNAIGRRAYGLVYGGGKVGLMGAIADSALAHDAKVIGVIPNFLARVEVLHEGLSETILVEDLYQRKAQMLARADAFAILPGGLGTFDEFLEVLTWRQLGQLDKPIGILDVNAYYDPWLSCLDHAVSHGFLEREQLNFVHRETNAERLLDKLCGSE